MTGTTCCVIGCLNNTKYNRNVSFHQFPASDEMKKIWIKQINKSLIKNGLHDGKYWYPTKHSKICGLHFNRSGFKTFKDQFPVFFPHEFNGPGEIATYATCEFNVDEIDVDPALRQESKPLHDHTYCVEKNQVIRLQKNLSVMGATIEELEKKLQQAHKSQIRKDQQIGQLSRENLYLRKQYNKSKLRSFSYEEVSQSSSDISFYTGLNSDGQFKKLVSYVKNTYFQKHVNPTVSLTMIEQLFLVLCRLKLGLQDKDLANRFDISVHMVTVIWNLWVEFLHNHFTKVKICPSHQLICGQLKYSKTTIILDSIEMSFETEFSSYTRAKGLIGVAPNGFVMFASDIHLNEISDKDLVRACRILDILGEGSLIIADRGFAISGLCQERNLNLNCFESWRESYTDVEKKKRTALLRRHMERVIRNIRSYKVFKSFPVSTYEELNKVWKICCHLVNFSGELFTDRGARYSSV